MQIDVGTLDSGERSLPFELLVFRIAVFPSVGKELLPWLFTCAVFILMPS